MSFCNLLKILPRIVTPAIAAGIGAAALSGRHTRPFVDNPVDDPIDQSTDNRSVEIDDLQLFMRLAHTGSMSEAARQLDITPASVSARLKRIEAALGLRLVERTTRSLRLTPEGERFLQTCEATLLAWTQGRGRLLNEAKSLTGRIHLAAPTDTSTQFLGPWISEYRLANPKLEVQLHVGDRMHDLPREAVDIAIRYGELADSAMISRLLVQSERVLVASPDYLKRHGMPDSVADLEQHQCLAWTSRNQPKVQWAFTTAQGISQSIVVKPGLCGDSLLVRQWALHGDGIAYKALVDVAADLRAGRLIRALPDHRGEPVPIHAVMPSTQYQPVRVRAMLAFLAERFKRL